jgi:8-oxo-dGTP pyrophosphatase MutT (NUDIX family)
MYTGTAQLPSRTSPETASASSRPLRREVAEETGWRAGRVEPLTSYNALSGISTMRFSSFHVTECEYVGPPTDHSEATRVEWIPVDDVIKLAAEGEITDGPSLTAISYYLGIYRQSRPS